MKIVSSSYNGAPFPGGPSSFEYDALGRLTASARTFGSVVYSYDPASRLLSETLPSGVASSYGYDRDGRMTSMSTAKPELPAEGYLSRQFEYGPDGNVSKMIDAAAGIVNYSYDALDRLVGVDYPETLKTILPDESYGYDDLGNRKTSEGGRLIDGETREAEEITYKYDDVYYATANTKQYLLEDDLYTYTYDNGISGDPLDTSPYSSNYGNLEEKTRKSDGRRTVYEYDALGRLNGLKEYAGGAAAEDPPVMEAQYGYDWAGRRVEKRVNGNITRYAYSGINLIAEFDASGEMLAEYRYDGGLDRPVAMIRGGKTFFYHYDERGSVIYLTNEEGHIIQRYTYDSFGRIALREGDIPNPFTYTGRWFDEESGLYYYRARHLDPDTGRFLQQDPVFSVNPYSYVDNNPIMNIDPLGLETYTNPAYRSGSMICVDTIIRPCPVYPCGMEQMLGPCSEIREPDHVRYYWDGGIYAMPDYAGCCTECWAGPKANDCWKKCGGGGEGTTANAFCFINCMSGGNAPYIAPDGENQTGPWNPTDGGGNYLPPWVNPFNPLGAPPVPPSPGPHGPGSPPGKGGNPPGKGGNPPGNGNGGKSLDIRTKEELSKIVEEFKKTWEKNNDLYTWGPIDNLQWWINKKEVPCATWEDLVESMLFSMDLKYWNYKHTNLIVHHFIVIWPKYGGGLSDSIVIDPWLYGGFIDPTISRQ